MGLLALIVIFVLKFPFACTVKLELETTSEYRSSAYSDHYLGVPILSTYNMQRPPVNNGLNFEFPRVAIVHRFDCTTKQKPQISILRRMKS
jgi:hypothetical protein